MHINQIRFNDKFKFNLLTWDKIIAIDFDDVIYHKNIINNKHNDLIDLPVFGSKEALDELKTEGWYIIIHSARVVNRQTFNNVESYLKKHNLYFDEIWFEKSKPFAAIYLDDKAITFKGNWGQSLKDIYNFKTWVK